MTEENNQNINKKLSEEDQIDIVNQIRDIRGYLLDKHKAGVSQEVISEACDTAILIIDRQDKIRNE
jgi:hypothetical protein